MPENSFFDDKEWRSIVRRFGFTPREKQILRLIAKGVSNKEIAGKLRIVPGTVKTHIKNIHAKMGFSKRPNKVRMLLMFWRYVRSF